MAGRCRPPRAGPAQRRSGPAPGRWRRPGRAGSRAAAPGRGPARSPARRAPPATPGWAAARRGRPASAGSVGARVGDDVRRASGVRRRAPRRPTGPSRSATSAARLGRAGQAADHEAGALLRAAQREDVPDVRVGRARLGVQVVAVVPDDDEPEVADRGEHRGPGADHRAHLAAPDREPAAVALGRPGSADRTTCRSGAEQAGQRGVDAGDVAVRRGRRRARLGRRPARCATRPGDLLRPAGTGQRRPDRPDGRAGVRRRRAARRRARSGPSRRARAAPGARRRTPGARLGLLDPGVPRRDRQPQHVGQRAGVAVGDGPRQPQHLGREHRLGRDDPLEERQPALVRRCRPPARRRSRRRAGRRTGPGPGTPGCAASASSAGTG